MPIPTSLEEIAASTRPCRHNGRATAQGPRWPPWPHYLLAGDLIELRRELVESTNCIANDLIKYCRRLIVGDQHEAIGVAAQILIDVTEKNWNRTREGNLTEIVKALAGSFGVDQVRAALEAVEGEKNLGKSEPPWRSK
jgi:hypothetical protein